jgi:hypothetical protein
MLGHGGAGPLRVPGQDRLDDRRVLHGGVRDVQLEHGDRVEQVVELHSRFRAGAGEQA